MASSDDEQMFITCEVCDLPFPSIKNFEQHNKGKKHKKQVEGQKRQKEVKSGDGDSCLPEAKDNDAQEYICNICELTFSGSISYTQHLKSRGHAKVLRKKKAEDDAALLEDGSSDSELPENDDADLNEALKEILPQPYGSCSVCEKKFSGPESYSQHMKSKSHAKRKNEPKLVKKLKAKLASDDISDTEEVSEERKKEEGSDDAESQKELKCKVCEKVFSTAVSFAQHMSSRTHAKREIQNKLLKDLEAIKALVLEEDSSSSEDEESPEVLTCEICRIVFSGPESLIAHLKSKNHQKALKWKKYLSKKKKSVEDGKAQRSVEDRGNTEKYVTDKETNSLAKSETTSEAVKGAAVATTAV